VAILCRCLGLERLGDEWDLEEADSGLVFMLNANHANAGIGASHGMESPCTGSRMVQMNVITLRFFRSIITYHRCKKSPPNSLIRHVLHATACPNANHLRAQRQPCRHRLFLIDIDHQPNPNCPELWPDKWVCSVEIRKAQQFPRALDHPGVQQL